MAGGSEPYSQFTVGNITWRNASKGEDYVLLVGLVAGFAAAWLVLELLDRRVWRTLGEEGVYHARSLVAYASLPLVIWAGGLVLGPPATREWIWFGVVALAVTCGLLAVASRAPSPEPGAEEPSPAATAGTVLLITLLGALSALIGAFALNRLALLLGRSFLWTGSPSPIAVSAAGAAAALAFGLWAWRGNRQSRTRTLRTAVLGAQLALPLGFLIVMPTPWVQDGTPSYAYPTGTIFTVALLFAALAYADIARRFGAEPGVGHVSDPNQRTPPVLPQTASADPLLALSPVALAGALLFVKFGIVWVGYFDADDYHFGELLLPWWSLVSHGAVPFWDHVPSRGLINYVNGAAGALVFDRAATGVLAAYPLVTAPFLVIGVVGLGRLIGTLPAAAAFLMMPVWHTLNQVDVFNTACLAWLLVMYPRVSRAAWLVGWVGAGTAAFLLAPAQGTALVLATMPLGAWQLYRAFRDERSRLLEMSLAMAAVAVLLLLATPLGRMLLGALRYGVENSAVGAPAHAVEWRAGLTAPTPLNHWLWEAVRTSWIAVGLAGTAFLISACIGGDRERRRALSLIGTPVVILAVVFIYRAAGRIDIGSVSRMGFASIWMLTLLLPMLLYAAWGRRGWPAIVTLSVAGGSLIAPVLGPVSLQGVAGRAYETIPAPPGTTEAAQWGLTQIGPAAVPGTSINRLIAIDKVLRVLLEQDETYLDLTNRNAQYFYLNRRVPIEAGALYNLPNESQQLRAIRTLETAPVPVVLAWAEPVLWDGGPQSYRTHAIYRYLIWRYQPVKVGELILLVRPDRTGRLEAAGIPPEGASDAAALLDTVFRQEDLQGLPASWGASWSTLEASVIPARRLDQAPALSDAVSKGPGIYGAAGGAPALTWSFSGAPVRGRDAGMLTFEFACLAGAGDTALDVTWAADGGADGVPNRVRFQAASRVAVPLDASPRWLLAPSIDSMTVRVVQPDKCSEFSLGSATLWQRKVAAATDLN
jgi:hypothetical protein